MRQATRVGTLVSFELVDGTVGDPGVAHGEVHHALKGRERTGDRVLRATLLAKRIEEVGDVIDVDLAQQSVLEQGKQVVFEVVAAEVERALAPLAYGDASRESLDPPARDLSEP